MHVKQQPRRRHTEEFKAQVLAACAEPGASVSAVALTFGLNDNLVHQWRRGRGYRANRASTSQPQFVALSLPAPPAPAAAVNGTQLTIGVAIKRGAVSVNVTWPLAASSDCAAWLRELLR